jgi:RND superfamily putative drug exporter
MLFWLVVVVGGAVVSGPVSQRLTVDYSLPGEPGTKTAQQISQTFGNGGYTPPYLVSVTFPEGQAVAGHESDVASAFDAIAAKVPAVRVLDEANTSDPAFRTRDGRTAYAMVFYHFDSSPTAQIPTERIRAALEAAKPAGTTVGVTGRDMLNVGSSDSNGPGVLAEVLIGAVGALAVLVFVFASMLAFLPLVVAAASILASFALLLPLTYLGDFSVLVEFLIALIGLGVAIDYSLLFVTRWREERHNGRDNHDAVVAAMQTAGRAVLFSGITVAIGLVSLLVLPVPFMRSVGIGGALIPLASVATTLSLTPALLGGVGPRIDWPRMRHNPVGRAWAGWARRIVQARWVAAGVSIAALLALVGVFLGVKVGLSSSESLARSGPAFEALETLKRGGVTTGNLTPIEVLVSADQARATAAELAKVDGIERAVVSDDQASNRDGRSVIVLVPDQETVNSKSVDVVERVRDRSQRLPAALGVTGIGAAQIDFLHGVYGNFPLMLTLIALLTYVLLVRAFRSLLLPLKAVLLNLLSLGATYGLIVLFWQHGVGSEAVFDITKTGAVTFWIPLMVFAFLFGLSMDYEVFILARMREEYDASGSTDRAVIEGIGRTGRLVTSAALILFLAFAALASGPSTDLKVMATGLGFGILLDATVVRALLVPSLVSLFGSWNWYLPQSVAKLLRVRPTHAIVRDPIPELEPVD